ncbi:zinc-binding dehydrogenase [Octadecabacter sp. SW4]|uniref:zinc-binding dehydrogenase n=1 Tax=Octadecabacter sp. SW4 TaxID=2602067 RepID=UPI0011C20031|nr:zinc-binding dehydrogenase [Octadecabacter sp. SW4]QEE34589.1 zinc-binding dehydrogenase [Octadecabacter sp. SW4]
MSAGAALHITIRRHGAPDVLLWEAEDLPEPAPTEVRVQVEAAGVSAYDVMLRGHRFPGFPALPYTPGEDIVGIVDKVGRDVTTLSPGQRVGGWTFGDAGGYAQYLCRPAADLVPVPDGLAPAAAVALIVNYLTASLALHQAAKVQPGERLLVQGAGGGLGSALLQLGREAGLLTYGCDAARKHDQISTDGAEPIDYKAADVIQQSRDLTDGGADVVIDLVGGARQLMRSWRALRPDGRLLMLGMAGSLRSGTGIILPSLGLLGLFAISPGERHLVKGPGMDSYPRDNPDWYQKTLSGFFAMALKGRLAPRVAETVPMHEAARAHAMLESGNVSGKVVLIAAENTIERV